MKYITTLKNVLYKLLLVHVTQNYTQPTMLRNVQKIKSATVDIQQATTCHWTGSYSFLYLFIYLFIYLIFHIQVIHIRLENLLDIEIVQMCI